MTEAGREWLTPIEHTADAGIVLLGLEPWAAREALARGRDLRGRVQAYLN